MGVHFTKLVLFIVLIGVAAGTGAGVWLARGLGRIYLEFYRFPSFDFELRPSIVVAAVVITAGSAFLGTLRAVRQAAMLPPAQAMRPEPPMSYKKTVLERIGLEAILSQPTRIILRNIERKPVKALLSVVGISFGCAVMIAARFFSDSVDFMVDVQFRQAQREDMTITYIEPAARRTIYELKGLSGVEHVEPFRTVPARFRFGHRTYRTVIQSFEPGTKLHHLLDTNLKPIELPPTGIVLTDYLATMLGIKPGDLLTVEVLEGNRPVRQVRVVSLVKQYIGVMGYMDRSALNRLMREGNLVSGAYLTVDSAKQSTVYRKLRVTVEEEGRTRVKDRFVVSAPVSGYLRRIGLEVGDRISRGRQIAALEPLRSTVLDPRSRAEAEAAVASAKAALAAAKEKTRAAAADAEYARERNIRMKKLAGGGFISKDDLEQSDSAAKKAEATRLSAEAAVIAAAADVERAESTLRYSAAEHSSGDEKTVIVRAPVSGRVLKIHHESEGVVNAGEPLLDIGNPGSLEVKAEVLSTDAVKIRKGTPVIFERWGGDRPLSGQVRVVEPAGFTKVSSLGVEEQRVLVITDFTSPPEAWQGLGDGYRLDASFIIWEGKDALQVPASALFRKGEGWALFTVENKRARIRTVEIGHRNGLVAEITKGLVENEPVIVHPDDRLKEGSRVRIK